MTFAADIRSGHGRVFEHVNTRRPRMRAASMAIPGTAFVHNTLIPAHDLSSGIWAVINEVWVENKDSIVHTYYGRILAVGGASAVIYNCNLLPLKVGRLPNNVYGNDKNFRRRRWHMPPGYEFGVMQNSNTATTDSGVRVEYQEFQ